MTSAGTISHSVARERENTSLLSACLAFFIPAIIGLYWVIYSQAPGAAVALLRPSVLGASILLAVIWSRRPATQAEVALAKVLALFCALLLIPSLTSTSPSRAFSDWSKIALLSILCLLWCRALRDAGNAKMVAIALIAAACILAALTLATYLKYMGFVLPTYKSARIFKGLTEKKVSFNAVAFSAIMAYLSAMCILRRNLFLTLLGVGLFVISTVFTGSRAPVGIVLLGAVIVFLATRVRSPRLIIRTCAWMCIAAILCAGVAAFFLLPNKAMSGMTEGRWDLWSVACQKFQERPLLGYGFESWRDDLVSRLPGDYALTIGIAKNIAGGYHNEYLTMLAEQGLIGALGGLYFFWFLMKSSWQLAFFQSSTWKHGSWAFFGCAVLMTRAGVEMPGLFGYGQEPADYLAYLFAAIVISRFSVEEDFLRANTQAAHSLRVPATKSVASGFRSGPAGIAIS